MTEEPPWKAGANQVRPIWEADVIDSTFARDVGGSEI